MGRVYTVIDLVWVRDVLLLSLVARPEVGKRLAASIVVLLLLPSFSFLYVVVGFYTDVAIF